MRRHLWTGAGLGFVGLGAVGAFLPLLPTVPFLLLAMVCFARGNPAWERRLLDHPTYGPSLRDWRERRAISRRAKKAALLAMALSVAVTAFTAGWPWVLIPLGVMALSGTWIWTRAE
ncbi:YbaN family protein [Novosphingobium sp. KCTC 2891]|uniref:YbaN family protein n=1 Tax=Novosphingobium sp. KCTC 2891 TaxID=2989730 RepID=UPI002222C8A3|nr:YbaN family protein [Novosphingobium sp. KCTC 2891]MCW1381550.1 YbaN family protein [Novosphingobium sp. KCTC 2891]